MQSYAERAKTSDRRAPDLGVAQASANRLSAVHSSVTPAFGAPVPTQGANARLLMQMKQAFDRSPRVTALTQLASTLQRKGTNAQPRQSDTAQETVQRKLLIGSDLIDSDDILHDGKQKRGIDRAISRRVKGTELKPLQVRKALAAMAESARDHRFASMREAIEQAMKMAQNKVGADEIAAIESEEDKIETSMKDHPKFNNFPKARIWKLLMDGKHHATRGKYGFENEKGYMAAMMRSFNLMLQTKDQPLDADLYEQLHDAAVGGVLTRDGDPMAQKYRDSSLLGEGFGLDMDTWSPEGHDELVAKYKARKDDSVGRALADHPDTMIKRSNDGQTLIGGRQRFLLAPVERTQAIRWANVVIDRYSDEIKGTAQDKDKQLTAIARVCQDLDQLHLFADGNIRTIVFLVLNKLLLQQGFDPVIMHEPNAFDGKSVDELKQLIKAGQTRYRAVRRGKK